MKVITLLTDFGLKDPYIGIMKGVILSLNPGATIIDITHEVEAQDVGEAAYLIQEYYKWFEPGAIHVAVVDPTVGSTRRPIIAARDGYFFVGPDNGIFSLLLNETTRLHAIENSDFMLHRISSTFHGRDIFSPAAAHLSSGRSMSEFGQPVHDPVRLIDLYPRTEGDILRGKIVRFDRFGNGITNISRDGLRNFIRRRSFNVEIGALCFDRISESYYENDMTCLFSSADYLEFGFFKGSFRNKTGVSKGDEVRIRLL